MDSQTDTFMMMSTCGEGTKAHKQLSEGGESSTEIKFAYTLLEKRHILNQYRLLSYNVLIFSYNPLNYIVI